MIKILIRAKADINLGSAVSNRELPRFYFAVKARLTKKKVDKLSHWSPYSLVENGKCMLHGMHESKANCNLSNTAYSTA